jgi:glycine cleavage system H protein
MRRVDENAWYDPDLNTWIKREGNYILVGLSDWAQNVIGKVSSIYNLPRLHSSLTQNMMLCDIESDKTVTEVIIPISGEIISLNNSLLTNVNWVNESCYDKGWFVTVIPCDLTQLDQMLSPEQYKAAIDSFFRKSS